MIETVPLKVVKLPHAAGLPDYATETAAGMDLMAATSGDVVLHPGERSVVPSGIAVAVPPGYEAQVRPRSGLAMRHGVTVLNSPGTIDADYRGEIGVLLVNLGAAPYVIERGQRIAQLVVAPVARAVWETVDALPETPRGAGGFGSTGMTDIGEKGAPGNR